MNASHLNARQEKARSVTQGPGKTRKVRRRSGQPTSPGLDSRSPIEVEDKLRGNDGLLSRIQYWFGRLIIATRRVASVQNRECRFLRHAQEDTPAPHRHRRIMRRSKTNLVRPYLNGCRIGAAKDLIATRLNGAWLILIRTKNGWQRGLRNSSRRLVYSGGRQAAPFLPGNPFDHG